MMITCFFLELNVRISNQILPTILMYAAQNDDLRLCLNKYVVYCKTLSREALQELGLRAARPHSSLNLHDARSFESGGGVVQYRGFFFLVLIILHSS